MTETERQFTRQSERFLDLALASERFESIKTAPPLSLTAARQIEATTVRDFRKLSQNERGSIRDSYFGSDGVAYFIVLNAEVASLASHPLFDLSAQLRDELHLRYPLQHPLEKHTDIVQKFGDDGTVKVFDFKKRTGDSGYREQGETSEMFSMHHDGLGSGGTVETAVLYADSGPLYGGYTFFQNMLRIAIDLAREDIDAFRSLFLPDAVEMIRPRGKGALKVVGPVLFLNEQYLPQSVFRSPSGEYRIIWRDDVPALVRARAVLERYAVPFAPGSTFLHMSRKGHGCFIRNSVAAHGRTAFVDSPDTGQVRVLSRKWYMRAERDMIYKHIPGLFIAPEYAALVPTLFGPERLVGEWLYDPTTGTNNRKTLRGR
jgi:hypothetical protein